MKGTSEAEHITDFADLFLRPASPSPLQACSFRKHWGVLGQPFPCRERSCRQTRSLCWYRSRCHQPELEDADDRWIKGEIGWKFLLGALKVRLQHKILIRFLISSLSSCHQVHVIRLPYVFRDFKMKPHAFFWCHAFSHLQYLCIHVCMCLCSHVWMHVHVGACVYVYVFTCACFCIMCSCGRCLHMCVLWECVHVLFFDVTSACTCMPL